MVLLFWVKHWKYLVVKEDKSMNFFSIVSILTVILLAIVINCSWMDNESDKLTLERIPYNGNELKLFGYYHMLDNDGLMTVYFLYQNGMILHADDFSPAKLPEKEDVYRNGQYYKWVKDDYTSWGVFHIDSNAIKFERWYPGDVSWKTFIRTGEILNDTTFHISMSQRSDGSEIRTKDETYHFRAFSPKPDSICPFIP
jgi:hypothetical protein